MSDPNAQVVMEENDQNEEHDQVEHDQLEPLPQYSANEPTPPNYTITSLPNTPRYYNSSGALRDPMPPELVEEVVALNNVFPNAIHLPILRQDLPGPGALIRDPHDPAAQERERAAYALRGRVVDLFFRRIVSRDTFAVEQFLALDLVAYNTRTRVDEMPLVAAALAGSAPIVRMLLNAGADPDELVDTFKVPLRPGMRMKPGEKVQRTPLQVAAAFGKLSVVRVLMEEAKADDAIIAPDGAIALRLAAAHGHRDIVEYLPARRGGGWLRFKTEHARSMRRIKSAVKGIYTFSKVLLWELPKMLVWTIPKNMFLNVRKNYKRWAKAIAEAVPRAARAAISAIVNLPGNLVRLVKGVPNALAKVGQALWRMAKSIWTFLKSIPPAIWAFLKSIPPALWLVVKWLFNGLKTIADATINAISRVLSLLHTSLEAIISFFRRVTLRDVWNGFVAVLRAVFVTAPKAVWYWIANFSEVSRHVLEKVFGFMGTIIWCMGVAVGWVVMYLPKKLWKVVKAIGSSIASAGREVWSWVNPKA